MAEPVLATDWRDYGYEHPGSEYEHRRGGGRAWFRKSPIGSNEPVGERKP